MILVVSDSLPGGQVGLGRQGFPTSTVCCWENNWSRTRGSEAFERCWLTEYRWKERQLPTYVVEDFDGRGSCPWIACRLCAQHERSRMCWMFAPPWTSPFDVGLRRACVPGVWLLLGSGKFSEVNLISRCACVLGSSVGVLYSTSRKRSPKQEGSFASRPHVLGWLEDRVLDHYLGGRSFPLSGQWKSEFLSTPLLLCLPPRPVSSVQTSSLDSCTNVERRQPSSGSVVIVKVVLLVWDCLFSCCQL